MKTLAFLQNQWFKNPDKVRAMIARHDEAFRRLFLKRALFAGCLTGRRLEIAFGESVEEIEWEETSRQIGGHSASVFRPDLDHIKAALEYHKPQIVLLFGKVAESAVAPILFPGIEWIVAPHPAARHSEVVNELAWAAKQWLERKSCYELCESSPSS